jgi:hypothetical protein
MDRRSIFWLVALGGWVVLLAFRRSVLARRAREDGRRLTVAWYLALWLPMVVSLLVTGIGSITDWAFFVWPLGFLLGTYRLWPGLYWFSGYELEYWIPLLIAFAVGLVLAWSVGGKLQRTRAGEDGNTFALFVLSFVTVYPTLFFFSWGVYFIGLRSGIGHILE